MFHWSRRHMLEERRQSSLSRFTQAGACHPTRSSCVKVLGGCHTWTAPVTEPRQDRTTTRAFRLGLPLTCWDLFSEAAQHHYSLCFSGQNPKSLIKQQFWIAASLASMRGTWRFGFGPFWCFSVSYFGNVLLAICLLLPPCEEPDLYKSSG